MTRTIGTTWLGVVAVAIGALASIGMHETRQVNLQPEAAQPETAEVAYRFQAFDLFVHATSADGTTEPGLAAWQVEYTGTSDKGSVLLVGLEGGDGGDYATPPHYDPAAMAGGRVILAAYTLDPDAPAGKTRVARLHLRVPMNATNDELNNDVKLMAAGDAGGARLIGRAWVEPMPAVTEPSTPSEPDTDNVKNSGANAPSEG